MSRRAAKIDGNQSLVVEALRAAGCRVQSLSEVGDGCPDLLFSVSGHNIVAEVKDPSQVPSKRRLTPMQKKWHAEWLAPVHLIETVEQALDIVAFYRKRKVA